ncbi:MAG: hypothetical protein J6Y58_03640 [Clostridiales bacterium]|nr:hypothetical protein [Clostridiales bacterium]
MAKQTRLATTLTARYFPTTELTDAFYMDGRVTSKSVARSADLTNDKEDRGFFFSVFSHQTNPDQDPNALPPYEPILRRLGTELKTGRRSLDDSIGEMVNTAVSITGKMKISQGNNRAPFFAGVMVKDGEAFASTIGKGLAFLYRDDTLYPMTATDIRIDAINTARQKVDNFYNFCATKTAPALCSNIAQLKLDDCIILCNREVYEALGQQELLRILYDAEDQSDAASVVITEAAAKLPGVPLQFMISFVEDITSSEKGGFFGFGRKKKKVVEEEIDDDDEYNVAPPVPLESPKKAPAPVAKDAMLFGDAPVKEKSPEAKALEATAFTPPVGTAADAIASLGAETASKTAAAAAAGSATSALVDKAINTPVPEPTLSFGDISELMPEDNSEQKTEAADAAPNTADAAPAKEETSSDDMEVTKVVPFVNSFDKAAAQLDEKIAEKPETPSGINPFVQPQASSATEPAKKDEPFVAVKNEDNPFFKAAVKAQQPEAPIPSAVPPVTPEVAAAAAEVVAGEDKASDDVSFEVGGEAPVNDGGAPLFIGDELFAGDPSKAPAAKQNVAGTEQSTEGGSSASVAETDEDAPLVFEAEDEVKKPMNDEPEYSNDPKEFDETPLFFGDAEPSAEDQYETHESYPSDYTSASDVADSASSGSSEFVIPFASAEAPNNATASANDVPEMPLYEAPSYVPPTYPTNSDTPVGYEDTGVYARGSYTVDEDEAAPSVSQFVQPQVDAAPVSPFVNVSSEDYAADTGYAASAYDEPTQEMPAVNDADFDPFAAVTEASNDAVPQYDFDNPPPSVADLFDVSPSAAPIEPQASSIPAYMQQSEAVRPGSVPGVSKRPTQPQRPGNRPNTQPARRRPDTIDDGFDNGDDEGQAGTFLPYVLAAVSLICLIIIIVLIAKSCSSSKKTEVTDVPSDTSVTDISGSTEPTTETTPEATEPTEPDPTAPIGIYTFSDQIGCRTWWDLFKSVYNIEIDNEKDSRVTTILTYNGLDSSYTPKAGESVKLPPPEMVAGQPQA